MNARTRLLSLLGLIALSTMGWSQGGPPGQGQQGPGQGQQGPTQGQQDPAQGGLSDAFVNVEPSVAERGQSLTLRFAFQTGVQAPPAEVNPTGADLGSMTAGTLERNGSNFVATFSIGAAVMLGDATLAVSFPSPNGTVTFEQAGAVAIQEASGESIEEPINEPSTDPEPVLIAEPPIPAVAEEEGESGLGSAPVSAATLSIQASDGDGAFVVTVIGDPGSSWQLQLTSDLTTWSDFAELELGPDGMGIADLPSLVGSRGYVRGQSTSVVTALPESPTDEVTGETDLYSRFSDNVEVFEEGEFIVLRSNGVPNHPSPYFGIGDPLYEIYNGDNTSFRQNPNGIAEQDLVFRVPKNPSVASNHEPTPLGPIGISINGVVFFNQYAGPNNQPLTNEINSFDQYGGHPAQRDLYHYHVEPLFLSGQVGRDGFLGVLLDGFPVYGPEENGVEITNADLDEFHGHFGSTKDHPEGIYHYHFTSEDPYLNGSGYYGAKGSVTQ